VYRNTDEFSWHEKVYENLWFAICHCSGIAQLVNRLATWWTAWDSKPGRSRVLPPPSRPALEPMQPLIQRIIIGSLSLGAETSSWSHIPMWNAWSFTYRSLHNFVAWYLGMRNSISTQQSNTDSIICGLSDNNRRCVTNCRIRSRSANNSTSMFGRDVHVGIKTEKTVRT
jgi:hypothetical protein